MTTIKQRLEALEAMPHRGLRLLPHVVDEHTTDTEIERLRRNGRAVYRENDPALYDEFV